MNIFKIGIKELKIDGPAISIELENGHVFQQAHRGEMLSLGQLQALVNHAANSQYNGEEERW